MKGLTKIKVFGFIAFAFLLITPLVLIAFTPVHWTFRALAIWFFVLCSLNDIAEGWGKLK